MKDESCGAVDMVMDKNNSDYSANEKEKEKEPPHFQSKQEEFDRQLYSSDIYYGNQLQKCIPQLANSLDP